MAFSEDTKRAVMQHAGYCCCICHRASVSLEVHHIVPQGKGGDDSLENAAPMCPTCHSDYGDNLEKKSRIIQMRDWWYRIVAQMYSGNIAHPEQLSKIHDILQNVNTKQDSILEKQYKHESDLQELRVQLKAIANKAIDSMTVVSSDITSAAVLGTAVSSVTFSGGGHLQCGRCGSFIDGRNDSCPKCGHYMG